VLVEADTTLDVVHLDAGASTAQLDRDIADRDKFVVAGLHCRIEHVVTARNRSGSRALPPVGRG